MTVKLSEILESVSKDEHERLEKVRKFLIDRVKNNSNYLITYGELNDECELGFEPTRYTRLHKMLADVSRYEHENGRPLITSIVIRKTDKKVGDGFYSLAKELGKFKHEDNKEAFLNRERDELVKYWKNHDK